MPVMVTIFSSVQCQKRSLSCTDSWGLHVISPGH
uniref:Uncharacterized protein n=1 Tax=Anguilla anguilla TaxID=7936 RepID=A0A0E9XSS9_ANGAN